MNEQIKRNQDLLKKVRRKGEGGGEKLASEADAFGYLYKAHKKEIRDTI